MIEQVSSQHYFGKKVKSNRIYLIILLGLCTTLGLLPVIHVDITNQSRGILRSPIENVLLQSLINGEVKSIFIHENSSINQGDTLLILNTEHIDNQITTIESLINKNLEFTKDLNKLVLNNGHELQTYLYQSEYLQFSAKIQELKTQLTQLKKEFDIADNLYNKQVIPHLDFLKTKNAYQLASKRKQLIKQQYLNKWNLSLKELGAELDKLNTQLYSLNNEKNKYFIIAPISGRIIQFSGHQIRSFIIAGQEIAFIAPDTNLIVECYIDANDIGYIYANQNIVYQLDAFNHHQWGLARGKVNEISSELKIINKQSFFSVRCSINKAHLQMKSGQKAELKKGMSLTARFYLARRSLWQLLFDKTDQWINPLLNTI